MEYTNYFRRIKTCATLLRPYLTTTHRILMNGDPKCHKRWPRIRRRQTVWDIAPFHMCCRPYENLLLCFNLRWCSIAAQALYVNATYCICVCLFQSRPRDCTLKPCTVSNSCCHNNIKNCDFIQVTIVFRVSLLEALSCTINQWQNLQ